MNGESDFLTFEPQPRIAFRKQALYPDTNVQINSIKGRIEALSAAPRQKEALLKLVESLLGKVFGRREVLMILGCAVATGTKYVAILESAGAIEPVQGLGKGKYRCAVK